MTAVQPEVTNKLAEWLDGGLKAWDISRDEPYFGFPIPGAPGKFFYVWMDAPVGYMASFANLCERTEGLDFDDFWRTDSEAEVHHVIGKDIVNFHCLFWPAVLSQSDFRTPTRVHVHGFITVDGARMSKSRGQGSSMPPPISTTSTPSTCATTSPPRWRRTRTTWTSTSTISSSG